MTMASLTKSWVLLYNVSNLNNLVLYDYNIKYTTNVYFQI